MREIRTSGSMSGDGKRSQGGLTETLAQGESGQQQLLPPPKATAPVLDSTHLTAKARNTPATTSLRLVTVLNVLSRVRDKFVTAGGAWPNNLNSPGIHPGVRKAAGARPRPHSGAIPRLGAESHPNVGRRAPSGSVSPGSARPASSRRTSNAYRAKAPPSSTPSPTTPSVPPTGRC